MSLYVLHLSPTDIHLSFLHLLLHNSLPFAVAFLENLKTLAMHSFYANSFIVSSDSPCQMRWKSQEMSLIYPSC